MTGAQLRVLGVLTGLYVASSIALRAVGPAPGPPWRFLIFLVLQVVPIAYGVAEALRLVESRSKNGTLATPMVFIALGLVLAWGYRSATPLTHVIGWALLAFMLWRLARGTPSILRPLAFSMLVLTAGYGAVWNLNYLAAKVSTGRLWDGAIRTSDRAIYGWLVGRPPEYEGFFPIVGSRFVFELLENAYLLFFVELFVVVFVLIRIRADLTAFFRSLFACYLIGVGLFLIFPVVGPCIAYPESFQRSYQGSLTHTVMQGMASEYRAVSKGLPLSGFGYFVGIPSLHVAIAVLLQGFLTLSRGHFWAFIPVNLLLSLSTFLLGYHYIVDALAGALLGLAILLLRSGRSQTLTPG